MKRCEWATSSEAMCLYHDREWGVPKTSDIDLFEMLVLEGAQAGLSWSSILNESSSPGESHPQALPEPYVNLSAHTAHVIQSNSIP